MKKKTAKKRFYATKAQQVRGRLAYIMRMFPRVTKVVDSDETVMIEVKKRDCKDAKPGDPGDCAMSRAAKRQFKADGAIVGLGTSYIIRGNTAIRFKSSGTVGREVVSFDRHGDFAPGIYRMSKVAHSARLGKPQIANREHRYPDTGSKSTHRTVRVRDLYAG